MTKHIYTASELFEILSNDSCTIRSVNFFSVKEYLKILEAKISSAKMVCIVCGSVAIIEEVPRNTKYKQQNALGLW